ncbi:hypothetical protein DPMN_004265 [Dreissena polymorpha]|uniref:Uncharacterized protein n=1 Tax=Dreissena polymorpha TaxID=45954 RepID=A0A9D4RSU8_DREPO|nr:hypothetical protein DPMN_004265 [Dreissena polymorpha]
MHLAALFEENKTDELTCSVQPQDIIRTNVLTKFHEEVLTRFYYIHIKCNSPTPGGHVFNNIIETNLLNKFHDDRTTNVASRVLTMFKCPAPWRPYIIGTNLTKFHDDQTINVASRVLTRKNAPPPLGAMFFNQLEPFFKHVQDIIGTNLTKENAPPPGDHVFQATITIFKLVQDIFEMNLMTKFHEDWTINVASKTKFFNRPEPFFYTSKISLKPNILTKFHEDWTINVTLRVLTRKMLAGSHVFKLTGKKFELVQDMIATNLLTKFHDDKCGPTGI